MMSRIKKDKGLMGRAHCLSSIAIYMLIASFFPTIVFDKMLRTENTIIFLISIVIIAGSSLLPDLDNTKSTAISTLGIVGQILSKMMRFFAIIVYNLSKTKYDDQNPNPHRAFWHTIVGGVLIGFIILAITKISYSFDINIKGVSHSMSVGTLFSAIWVMICARLGIAGLFGTLNKKIKSASVVLKILWFVTSLFLIILFIKNAPKNMNVSWIAYITAIGYILHILGDTITTMGTPILWPISTKGKRWWYHRIIGIKAGGNIENFVIIPLSILGIATSIFKMFLLHK